MKKQRPPMPPWLRDPHPELWVPAALAARFYFMKSLVTVKRYIKTDYLKENGFQTFWDGKRWFIRLPYPLAPSQRNHKRQSARARA
jgi:hypothetical protein